MGTTINLKRTKFRERQRHLFENSLGHGLASKECDEFFNLIREIRGLMAGFFAPQSAKQQFLTGSLVLSIVAGIAPKLVGSRTMTQPPGTFVSTPATS